MSTYEEFMILLTIVPLITAILDLKKEVAVPFPGNDLTPKGWNGYFCSLINTQRNG